MIIELLLALFLGILTGIISGLTPGIHINMISLVVMSISQWLINDFGVSVLAMAAYIISVGVTHTFLDAVPSIYLGAPDENTVLGVLPGHRYLLSGNGYMAVKLFTIGSFFGLVAGIMMFPLLYLITKYSYDFLSSYFAIILILTTLFMIYKDNRRMWAIFVVIMSGIMGMIVFNVPMNDPLFPMLSGLFGISTLIISLNDNNNIPDQKIEDHTKLKISQTIKSIMAGNFSAFIVSTFPGLSSSIAAVMSMQIVKDLKDKGFMILMGCIGTSSFVLSLVALYTINKARNGAVIVLSALLDKLDLWTVIILLIIALIAGSVSFMISLWFGRIFSKIITKINYKLLVCSIITLVCLMVFIMTSWIGLLVLITSTSIGLIPGLVKVKRTQSMACLIIPIIFYLI